MSILYLSYDGLMEPLGQSQVLQYLQRLAKDYRICLVTYEKKKDWEDKVRRKSMLQVVQEKGIHWIPLRYHKCPSVLATTYDWIVGFIMCVYICKRYSIKIVHARGYVICVLGLWLKRIFGIRLIFDTRSFWPDERVELGIWKKESLIYRISKWLERRILIEADVIVALTQKAVDLIQGFVFLQGKKKRFEVIPTCTNLDLFRPALDRKRFNKKEDGRPFILGYVGSLGACYLFDQMLEFFKALKRKWPNARLLIINRNNHVFVREKLQAHGIGVDSVEIKAVDYQEVPCDITRMDAGMYLISPDVSRVSAVPTKMGEFLGCGVPCLANVGVGNIKEILENDRTGIVVRDFDPHSIEKAVDQLLELASDPEVRDRCVLTAKRYFSLEIGVRAYDRIYRDLAGKVYE